MSTPYITPQLKSYSLTGNGPLLLSGLANSAAGTPIDLSSGFSALVQCASNPSAHSIPGSFTGNSDGTWQISVASSDCALIPFGTRNLVVTLSNDSFTTGCVAQSGSINRSQGAAQVS